MFRLVAWDADETGLSLLKLLKLNKHFKLPSSVIERGLKAKIEGKYVNMYVGMYPLGLHGELDQRMGNTHRNHTYTMILSPF
jgi:hypothetical protein